MTPQKLRDRRRLRHQMAVYHEAVRAHQENMRQQAEALARQDAFTAEVQSAVNLMIAQINAPFYALMHELELGAK